LAAVLCALLPIHAHGQTQTTGKIAGTVQDRTNALVVGAEIRAQNSATGEARTTTTDESGNYALPFLPPGTYECSASAHDFATARLSGVRVGLDQTTTLNVVLSVAATSSEVTVIDAAPLVPSNGSQIATEIEGKPVSALPLASRNAMQLPLLTPGISADIPKNNAIGRNSPNFFANGARSEQNNLQINGTSRTRSLRITPCRAR
jgi:hypothetical protein